MFPFDPEMKKKQVLVSSIAPMRSKIKSQHRLESMACVCVRASFVTRLSEKVPVLGRELQKT